MIRIALPMAAAPLLAATLLGAASAAAQTEQPPGGGAGEGADPGAQPAPPQGQPPPHYYVEPPDPSAAESPGAPATQRVAPAPSPQGGPPPVAVNEPPLPGQGYGPQLVWEPPPPPKPRHVAPKYSFWLGARLGWFIPFGNLWARCTGVDAAGFCRQVDGTGFSDYASSGPMLELDIGARLGRNYNVFLLWERAELGAGNASPDPVLGPTVGADLTAGQVGGDTDFWAVALRVSSDPDKVGFQTEIALGFRRFRARWEDGTELQLTNAPFEARLGLGADIRLSPGFALSPLLTLGVGSFSDADWVGPDGTRRAATDSLDTRAGHGWLTLHLGAHFDIAGSQ